MKNSNKPLLSQHWTVYNNYDQLYNEIIEIFQVQKIGWIGGLHDTISKKFVTCFTDALWYINPHLSTLHARTYHLPVFFTQLWTYQDGGSYNKFYYTSHHKKNLMLQQKLVQLSSSLELFINQPWVCNDLWNQVMPEILFLVEILRKYSEYLVTTTASMSKLHHSNESARNSENSSTIYQIPACKCDSLHENYIQLNDAILEKQVYRYIDIQPYLPINIMKRYWFIKELQLTFPIGIYRLVFLYYIFKGFLINS